MNQITMTDITMNQNTRRAEFSLSFREKIELAKLLDRLGVDAILTTPITENRSDSLLIKSISSAVKESAVAVPVGLEPATVDLALKALTEAVHPRLVAEAPVSAVQMEYLAGKKPAALLAAIEDTVSKASALCQDVEFVAVDATRADMAFLKDALTTAIRSGAGIITLVDTAGDMLPEEFAAFINEVRQNVPDLGNVRLGVDCCNKLSMADANAVAAITGAGVTEIKASAYALNSVSLEHLAFLIATRGETIGAETRIHNAQLHRMVGQIERLCRTGNPSSGKTEAKEDEDVFLTAHDSEEAVLKAVAELGYELSEDPMALTLYFGSETYELTGIDSLSEENPLVATYNFYTTLESTGDNVHITVTYTYAEEEGEEYEVSVSGQFTHSDGSSANACYNLLLYAGT